MKRRHIGVLIAACLLGGACTTGASPAATSSGGRASSEPLALTVYGAASLKGALDAAKVAYEAVNRADETIMNKYLGSEDL